jgi:hypothetical protein
MSVLLMLGDVKKSFRSLFTRALLPLAPEGI